MTHKTLKHFAAIAVVCATASAVTSAVGNGLPFVVHEVVVPAFAHDLNSNSLDFTYHSCVNFINGPGQPPQFVESGYFPVSSYQGPVSVVDSQINDFQPNGYHIYATYRYQAQFVNFHNPSPSGLRLNYVAIGEPLIEFYLDPLSNTAINLVGCAAVVNPETDNDDRLIGSSTTLILGEKSETNNVAANGDFELRFGNWTFTADGEEMFQFAAPADFYRLVLNANITRLIGGTLTTNHRAEGSGNLFWWPQPQN